MDLNKKPEKKPMKQLLPGLDPMRVVECPLCLEVIVPPISHCEVGHAMCKKCFDESGLKHCPQCMRPVSTKARHVGFEQLLESLSLRNALVCRYTPKGCNYNKITAENKENHERDCRYRTFRCEGKIFADWECNWSGEYKNLEQHFKVAHKHHTMQYKTDKAYIKVNFHSPFKDVYLISFFNGQAYLYYKHYVDVAKEKLYWAFQYIGLKSNAEQYFYEFEIHNGPVRKFKVSEICHNDTTKIEDIFELEKCVVMSFASARNFLNDEGELPFRFRIVKVKPDHH